MYVEGYEWEGLLEAAPSGGGDSNSVVTGVHQSGGTTITDRRHETTFSGLPNEMAAFGFQERTI